jgi:NAD(P)H-flavin reductase/hemoglobin-like flavoprotein
MGQRTEDVGNRAPVGPLLDDDEIGLVEETLSLLSDRYDDVVADFYAALFVQAPALRQLFPPGMDAQRDRLFRALTGIARSLGDPERAVPLLTRLGRDHRKFGVRAEHYEPFGQCLVLVLSRHAADVWVPELEAAWRKAYAVMAETMIEGAREAAERAPAWWRGEIVTHERRAADIAVVTVRTDRPYDYEPGQYASIETGYRPRSWRTYSMATAPRVDGLLEFHVRAVGAGWVSGPLVWRAQVGDRLRLGAPNGDLQVDQRSRRDLVCIAGGTGLAPVKAIVDGMTRWNTARRVTVFFGARTAAELYDLDAVERLASSRPWLTVVPAVSEEPSYPGERGLLPDVVARHGRWADHDVFVSGSPAMTRATLSRLSAMGVPPERVSYDEVDAQRRLDSGMAQVIDLRKGRASRSRSHR